MRWPECRTRGLSFVAVPLEVEDVAIEGLVLGLLLEGSLILHHFAWVFHASTGASTNGTELLLMRHLVLRVRRDTSTVRGSVVEFTCLAVCKADLVVLSHLAVDCFHWECVFYFCQV